MGLYCSRRVMGLGPWSLDRDIQEEGASTSKCVADAPLQYVTPQGNFKKYRETNRAYKHSLLKTEFVGKIKILVVSEMKH